MAAGSKAAGVSAPGAQPAPSTDAADGEAPKASGTREAMIKDWSGREVAGRYKIIERLGEGGMGVVYVAEHLSLKKKVAFKVIHPELAAHEELLLRFQREALATGQLDHPHITAAIDFGELEGGGAFMVMPWVRGHSLQAELDQKGRMEFRRAAQLCAQIADALSAAHATGVVHRDLKPDNVLLETRNDGSESAKVLDFGVASLAGRAEGMSIAARPLTQAGTILGTPGYMSPEQASAGEVDHRTDIYALGVIMWELCRGERLFSGSSITEIFSKQFKSVPPPLELGLSSSARELSTLADRMLAWDKNARPNTAAEVRDALRRIAAMPDNINLSLRLPVSNFARKIETLPLPAKLEPYRSYLPYVLTAALTLLVLMIWQPGAKRGGEPQAKEDPALSETPPKPGETVAPPAKPEAQAAPSPAPEPSPAPAPAAPAASSSTSAAAQAEVREAIDNLLNSRAANARKTAAKWLLRHAEQTPRYAELMADLELNTRCNDKKAVVEQMRNLQDPRVLPALERLADSPRRGCGLIRLSDCYACLRRDLDQVIGGLRARR
ncbi:MAG TPA: serine/threonine-protein kinase [Polyangiaceae bacterium]|nr:serine/threonine-protein kinase [Polyangiaceae bacterium]